MTRSSQLDTLENFPVSADNEDLKIKPHPSRDWPVKGGRRHWLLGRPVPARESSSPYGRLSGGAQAAPPDPDGVSTFRTHEIRPGRVSSLPRGRRCSPRPSGRPWSPSAALQRLALPPRYRSPTRDVRLTRHQQGFRVIHPSGLPLTCSPRSERAPSGFPLSSAPGRYQPRTSGWGRVWNTNPKSRLRHHAEPPIDEPTHNVRPRVAPPASAAPAGVHRLARHHRQHHRGDQDPRQRHQAGGPDAALLRGQKPASRGAGGPADRPRGHADR